MASLACLDDLLSSSLDLQVALGLNSISQTRVSQILSPRSLESGCGETELVIVRLPVSRGGVGAEKTSVHGSGATEQEDSSQR